MPESIAIVIAERESLYRRGLATCLSVEPMFQIVASVGTARDAYRAASQLNPHLVLVGTTLPDRPGLLPVAELRLRQPGAAIVVMADTIGESDLVTASSAGAAACVQKDVTEDELLRALRRVANDEYLINEQMLQLFEETKTARSGRRGVFAGDAWSLGGGGPLTGRELQILKSISDGMTNAEIGDALGISIQTVKNHVTSILRKLAVNDRTQAVVLAMRRGWLPIDDRNIDTPSLQVTTEIWGLLPHS